MNKSLATNTIAVAITAAGILLPSSAIQTLVFHAGLFALSGALTNWIAVHMLFEKVPGFYGSGVIIERFDAFKEGIMNLVMENFFTEENFKMFADAALHQGVSKESIHELVDMDDVFNSFLRTVENSKFGGMLAFVGGLKALEPLRAPFKVEMQNKLDEILDRLDLTKGSMSFETFRPTVEKLVQGKLDQLKPEDVRNIVEKMIREHLGWLVVWGGVFGGLIGLASSTWL